MRWVIYCLKVTFAGGLVYWLIDSNLLDLSPLLNAQVSWYFFLGPLAVVLSLLIGAVRWSILLHVHHQSISFRYVASWVWIGEFFASFTPGGGGGELARVYYIFRNTEGGRLAAISTVILDRAIGLYSLLFMGAGSYCVLYFWGEKQSIYLELIGLTVISLFLGITVMFLTFFIPAFRDLSLRILPSRFMHPVAYMYDAYLNRKMAFLHALIISFVSQVFLLSSFFLAGMHLGTPLDFLSVLLVVPLVFLANTLPLSPGGVGVGETAASLLFLHFGIPNGASVMLIYRLWLMLVQLPGGLIFLIQKNDPDNKKLIPQD